MVVAIGVITVIVNSLTSSKSLDTLATPALERNAANSSQKNDVARVIGAVSGYVSSHDGVLPTTTATGLTINMLNICGAVCTGSDKVSVTLSYFKNTSTAVKYRSYANDVTVPDSETLYIVNNATCKRNNSGIGYQTTKDNLSAAFLYAYPSSTGITQQCLGL